jgi:hypothetical protein
LASRELAALQRVVGAALAYQALGDVNHLADVENLWIGRANGDDVAGRLQPDLRVLGNELVGEQEDAIRRLLGRRRIIDARRRRLTRFREQVGGHLLRWVVGLRRQRKTAGERYQDGAKWHHATFHDALITARREFV